MGSAKQPESQILQDKRIVEKKFQESTESIRKNKDQKHQDFKGLILKRRREATLEWLPKIRERYAERYPDLDVVSIWAEECSAPGLKFDLLDSCYHVTLAAAIWMLDALDQGMLLRHECVPYLERVTGPKEAARIPELHDPKYSNPVIEAMTQLIRCRNEREEPFRSYLNETTAKYGKDQELTAVEGKNPDKMTNSDIFYTLLSKIPSELAERATGRFENKMWEFLDIIFENASIYHKKIQCAERQRGQLYNELISQNRPPVNNLLPKDIQLDMQKLDREKKQKKLMVAEFDQLNDHCEKLGLKGRTLCQYAHQNILGDGVWLEQQTSKEDADRLTALHVEDPYEICFGFLYLVEKRASLPWLYNAPMGILFMALKQLPWMTPNGAGKHKIKFDAEFGNETDFKKDVFIPSAERRERPDWTPKKASLYRLCYEDTPLYSPMPSTNTQSKLNLPQLLYGMTNVLMPRCVHWFDETKEEFTEAGMDPGLAEGMELYLQLASDCRHPIDFPKKEAKQQEAHPVPKQPDINAIKKEMQAQLAAAELKCEKLQEQITRQQAYQKQLEEEKKELRQQMQKAEIEQNDRLKEKEEKIAYLKRKIEQPKEREKIASWVKKQFSDRLVLHPRAVELLNDRNTRSVDIALICDALDFLATDYWEQWQGKLTQEEVNRNCSEKYGRPFEIKATGDGAIAYTRNQYTLQYTDQSTGKSKERTLDFHLRVGNSPETLLRIYYFHDKENGLIVVGSLPDHLRVVKMQ